MKNIHKIDQHIYITNDEEPSNAYSIIRTNDEDGNFTNKKIILTTDPEIIQAGVQPIDDEFLEWFVKNPSCERVEVEKQWVFIGEDKTKDNYLGSTLEYKIIIPKKETSEKMYSEDEVETIAKEAYSMGRNNLLIVEFNKWFEQFKNK